MAVRAKLQLVSIANNVSGQKTLRFEPRYDTSIPEDMRFQKATPWGSLEMIIDNPVALAQFELGKTYYLDMTPVAG